METRIVSIFERSLTTSVNNIEHIESQSLNGVGIQAIRNPEEVHDAATARWQKAAFIEDLSTPMQI